MEIEKGGSAITIFLPMCRISFQRRKFCYLDCVSISTAEFYMQKKKKKKKLAGESSMHAKVSMQAAPLACLQGKERVEKSRNSTVVLWVCEQHGSPSLSLPCPFFCPSVFS